MGSICCKGTATRNSAHHRGGGRALGGSYNTNDVDEREARARAAEQRLGNTAGISDERNAALRDHRVKQDLIGKIELEYRKKGQDPPMGLNTCDIPQLRRTLDRLRA
eukprot:gb/GECG01010802.1/.p1 GENE.gb/GECG01010802.1/~~gb/GECG01010802.1/.p1  ORF type:complete len:107 (+),score=12.09 gb/GECG01010802.1/:1-321(+)